MPTPFSPAKEEAAAMREGREAARSKRRKQVGIYTYERTHTMNGMEDTNER